MDWNALLVSFLGNPIAVAFFFFIFLTALIIVNLVRRSTYLNHKNKKYEIELNDKRLQRIEYNKNELEKARIHKTDSVKSALSNYK